jgi:hypothetical protein
METEYEIIFYEYQPGAGFYHIYNIVSDKEFINPHMKEVSRLKFTQQDIYENKNPMDRRSDFKIWYIRKENELTPSNGMLFASLTSLHRYLNLNPELKNEIYNSGEYGCFGWANKGGGLCGVLVDRKN